MYKKKFDEWNMKKKSIHTAKKEIIINTKDIWFVSLGCNIGREQDGKKGFLRPVLVIRRIGSLYFTIPLTTKEKKGKWYYVLESLQSKKSVLSTLILSQGRVLDKKRFVHKLGHIKTNEMRHIKKLLKDMYLGEVL